MFVWVVWDFVRFVSLYIWFFQFRQFFILLVVVVRLSCCNLCEHTHTHSHFSLEVGVREVGMEFVAVVLVVAFSWTLPLTKVSNPTKGRNNNIDSYYSNKRSNERSNNAKNNNNRNNLSPRAIAAIMSHSPISRTCRSYSSIKERHHECQSREFLLPWQARSEICI